MKSNTFLHSNQNYNVCVRVSPVGDNQEMLQINKLRHKISILQNQNDNQNENEFVFNQLFKNQDTQEEVFKYVSDNCLAKMIDGHNGCIMNYGQSNSGKTYTLFGDQKEDFGIVGRTIEYLIECAKEFEDLREFEINCSVIEIYLDSIRDLTVQYKKNQQNVKLDEQDLKLQENANGQVTIENLRFFPINSIQDMHDLIKSCFNLRAQNDSSECDLKNRAHTIVSLQLIQKDKLNDNMTFLQSTVQFVDLAGSERIAKSLIKGKQFQESVLINSSLSSLGKCLLLIAQSLVKNIPYDSSKLTRVLQNTIQPICSNILILNVNPTKQNYDECLSTLQFGDRTRSSVTYKKQFLNTQGNHQRQESEFGISENKDDLIRKLNDEHLLLRNKLEQTIKENSNKMDTIKNIFGLDIDISKIMSRSMEKDMKNFNQQKEALVQITSLKLVIKEQTQRIEDKQKQITQLIKDGYQENEKLVQQLLEEKEVLRKLNDQIQISRLSHENLQFNISGQQEKQIQLLQQDDKLINRKQQIILKQQKQQVDVQKLKKITSTTKFILNQGLEKLIQNPSLNELGKTMPPQEPVYQEELNQIQESYKKVLSDLQNQYEYFLKFKTEEIQLLENLSEEFRNKKKTESFNLKKELIHYYDIVKKQSIVISKIEHGRYSTMRTLKNLKLNDLFKMPDRQNFPNLYDLLDQKHFKSLNQDKTAQTQNNNLTQLKSLQDSKNFELSAKFDENKEISQMEYDDLLYYTKQLQQLFKLKSNEQKELENIIKQFEVENNCVDFEALIKENDEYIRLIKEQKQKSINNQIAMQSQNRIISKPIQKITYEQKVKLPNLRASMSDLKSKKYF